MVFFFFLEARQIRKKTEIIFFPLSRLFVVLLFAKKTERKKSSFFSLKIVSFVSMPFSPKASFLPPPL